MSNDWVRQLLESKRGHRLLVEFQTDDQDFDHSLRQVITDLDTGQVGLFVIEPLGNPFENECQLDYSWQELESPFGTPPEECLILDLKTNLAPEFEVGETPSMFELLEVK